MDTLFIARKIEKALSESDNRPLLFISGIDRLSLCKSIEKTKWKYVIISIRGVDDIFRLASQICFNEKDIVNSIPNANYFFGSAYQKQEINKAITDDFILQVLYELNIKGQYVIILYPADKLLESKEIVDLLESVVMNNLYDKIKFVSLTDECTFKLLDGTTDLFNSINLDETSNTPNVYISYSWQEPSNHIVMNDIVPALKANNINFTLDKNDCDYMTNIPEFEQRIGHGENIIVVVSKPYIHSIQCMYEISFAIKCGNIQERVHPILLGDFDRTDVSFYNKVVDYWENEYQMAVSDMQQSGTSDNDFLKHRLEYIEIIKQKIHVFWNFLNSYNTLTLTELGRKNFSKLINRLRKDIQEPLMDTNINPITSGTTANQTIVIKGNNNQINCNSGSGTINVNNQTCSMQSILPDEDKQLIINRYFEEKLTLQLTKEESIITNEEDAYKLVLTICDVFQNMVEKNNMSSILYRDNRKPDETDWQLMLFGIMLTYIKACNGNLNVERESISGSGKLDLFISRGTEIKICIEMKVSGNGNIVHGYEEQIVGYMASKDCKKGIYIIVIQDDLHQSDIQKVQDIKTQKQSEGIPTPEVIIIDGKKQLSPSNPKYKAPR